jgi:hypothetical protein
MGEALRFGIGPGCQRVVLLAILAAAFLAAEQRVVVLPGLPMAG